MKSYRGKPLGDRLGPPPPPPPLRSERVKAIRDDRTSFFRVLDDKSHRVNLALV